MDQHHIYIPKTWGSHYLPKELAACDMRQYIEMAALILRYQCNEVTLQEFRVHGLYKLLNMKTAGPKLGDTEKFANIYRLSLLLDSFFEADDRKQQVIRLNFIHNPIPKFRGAWRNYYGPSDEFNNITFGEYVDGLGYFIDFNQTGELQYLYNLLAVFYRPRKSLFRRNDTSDNRQGYVPAHVEHRAEAFHNVHPGVVYGFYLLFASFQKYMTSCTLFVEGKEIDLSVLFDGSGSAQKESDLPGTGMKGVMYSFAESGVFGTLEQVRQAPLWEAMLRMYDLYKRSKDFEANQPN